MCSSGKDLFHIHQRSFTQSTDRNGVGRPLMWEMLMTSDSTNELPSYSLDILQYPVDLIRDKSQTCIFSGKVIKTDDWWIRDTVFSSFFQTPARWNEEKKKKKVWYTNEFRSIDVHHRCADDDRVVVPVVHVREWFRCWLNGGEEDDDDKYSNVSIRNVWEYWVDKVVRY